MMPAGHGRGGAVVGYSLSFGPPWRPGRLGPSAVLLGHRPHHAPGGGRSTPLPCSRASSPSYTRHRGAVAEVISSGAGWPSSPSGWSWCMPLCHWVWAADGSSFNLGAKGAIDFAGPYQSCTSPPVRRGWPWHVSWAPAMGTRRQAISPNNLTFTLIGAGWDHWSASTRAPLSPPTWTPALTVSAAAPSGALTWVLIDHPGRQTHQRGHGLRHPGGAWWSSPGRGVVGGGGGAPSPSAPSQHVPVSA